MDFAGPFIELTDPDVTINSFHREIGNVAVTAQHLDSTAGNPFRHFRCKQFGHAGLLQTGDSCILQSRGVPYQQSRRFYFGGHIGQPEPDGLMIDCLLVREDVRDGFISPHHASISDLPHGAVVGTSSVRRKAQLQRLRPDVEIVQFRGNVQTRLRKLQDGVAAATFLACAGLNRLGQSDLITAPVSPEEMLPAVAQGAIGVEVRADDSATRDLLRPLNHEATEITVRAERAFLAVLDGSCRTPMAGLAEISGDQLRLRACVLSMDGARFFETERTGPLGDAAAMGQDAGEELKSQAGPDIFSA